MLYKLIPVRSFTPPVHNSKIMDIFYNNIIYIMSKIPDNVLNPKLYKKAKEEADKKFEDKTSAYKSMWISKKYKDLGGKYSGKKKITN